jgi:ABC-type nickel/cobalt efflux system permease component RcnA
MTAIDARLEGLMHGPSALWIILLVSLALGLRHATDPDHLAAVTSLIVSDGERGRVSKAGLMGLLWGLGHATTVVLVGVPLVLLGRFLPETAAKAAEVAIGIIIALLATRLLLRWRRGLYHAHSHDGELAHRHVHSHASGGSHEHDHRASLRTLFSSYGIGLVHGIGGSGGLTLLLLSTISDKAQATIALLLFATGTALSMALLSSALGVAIAGGPIGSNFGRLAPALGVLSMTFGAWYALGALELVPYPL